MRSQRERLLELFLEMGLKPEVESFDVRLAYGMPKVIGYPYFMVDFDFTPTGDLEQVVITE
jgi:hypothetical protein